ncbi:MAG TPA: HAD-IA family hydrolase [Thermohalobaculum sp.]|nr:HAD-IA family hydrolase [Thermohalobaculum sp.]
MQPERALVIFDVDGTLVDSRRSILAAMAGAFAGAGRPLPPEPEVLGIVGLSLPQAMAALVPDAGRAEIDRLVHLYKESYIALRRAGAGESAAPLFPGALDALDRLQAGGHTLSIATGKARRGLDHMLATHGLGGRFVATQTADDAPSKPDPGMVLACLAATGFPASAAIVVGDTAFDMGMARAAGARAIGVSWGYHEPTRLMAAGAECVIGDFRALDAALAGPGRAA